MKIAIDYDRTWTADPLVLLHVATVFHGAGHQCYIVTARSPTKDNIFSPVNFGEPLDEAAELLLGAEQDGVIEDILYCDGVAKRWALHHYHDIDVDIWIDDKPDNILANSTATKEILAEWRANGRI
jgi:hypothetical protein